MNKIKENKTFSFAPVAVMLLFFFRSLFLTDRNYLGIADLFNFKMEVTDRNITLIILLVMFAVLGGFVIGKLNRKFGEAATFLSVLLIAEPFLFAKQMNCVVVFIADVALLFILNALCEKRLVPNEITFIAFILISCILTENAIFLFVLPAVILYFIGDAENIFKSRKKLIMIILAVISVGAGIAINDRLMTDVPAFQSFIKEYTFFQNIYFKHISYENIFLFLFCIPTTAFGIYFLVEFVKLCDEKRKNTPSYVAVALIFVAYILSVVGFILKGSAAFYTINYIVPLSVFALIANGNNEAQSALAKVNEFISKHALIFILVEILLFFISVTVFFKEADNIAGFLLSI